MIIVGWGKKVKVLGEVRERACINCGNYCRWQVVQTYSYASLYFIPLGKLRRAYFLICPICQHGYQLTDESQARDLLAEAVSADLGIPRNSE